MSLKEIAVACGGVYYGSEEAYHQEVTGVAIDSRKVEPGFLFVAVRGARVDGHVFIPQVMEKGALCAIFRKTDRRSFLSLYSGKFFTSGPKGSGRTLPKILKHQSCGNHRKCRKDQYQRNDCFGTVPEI